jgi:hypothetical protein
LDWRQYQYPFQRSFFTLNKPPYHACDSTGPISIGLTTLRVRSIIYRQSAKHLMRNNLDYEQQRLHLLHKHGIDLEDSNGLADATKTRRMDRKDIERLMDGGEGPGGIFTWREKHRRKVPLSFFIRPYLTIEID